MGLMMRYVIKMRAATPNTAWNAPRSSCSTMYAPIAMPNRPVTAITAAHLYSMRFWRTKATVDESDVIRTIDCDMPVMMPGDSSGRTIRRIGTAMNPPPAPINAPTVPATNPRNGINANSSSSITR